MRGWRALRELGVPFTHVPYALSASQFARALTSVALRRACTETALYDSRLLAERFSAAVEATHPDVVHVDRVRTLPLVRRLAAPTVVDVTDPRLGTYRHYRHSGQLRPLPVRLPATMRAWLDQRPALREEVAGLRGVPTLVASEIGREMLLSAGANPAFIWPVPNAVFASERAEPLLMEADRLACRGHVRQPLLSAERARLRGAGQGHRSASPSRARREDCGYRILASSPARPSRGARRDRDPRGRHERS